MFVGSAEFGELLKRTTYFKGEMGGLLSVQIPHNIYYVVFVLVRRVIFIKIRGKR